MEPRSAQSERDRSVAALNGLGAVIKKAGMQGKLRMNEMKDDASVAKDEHPSVKDVSRKTKSEN